MNIISMIIIKDNTMNIATMIDFFINTDQYK